VSSIFRIAERGFAATRLDDVAERAGITKGTLYLYFPSKEDLFKAVVRQQLLPNIERAEAPSYSLSVCTSGSAGPVEPTIVLSRVCVARWMRR
jgi:AcrR family transcriptional regulator